MSEYAYLDGKDVVTLSFDDYLSRQKSTPERGNTWERVGLDEVGEFIVSTVFLGMDHGFGGVPQWFETMVFPAGNYCDKYCARYATYEQAEIGHKTTVEKLKAGTLEMY